MTMKAVFGFCICIAVVQIAPIHSLGQIDQFPVLSELSGSLLIDDKSVIGDFAGLQIRDLDAAQLDDDFKAKAEMCKSHEDFREALCETLIAPETCLEAYVLLNHLYPEHRLSIVRGSFRYNAPENAKIPLRIVSGDTSVVVRVNLASFGNICKRCIFRVFLQFQYCLGVKASAMPAPGQALRHEHVHQRRSYAGQTCLGD